MAFSGCGRACPSNNNRPNDHIQICIAPWCRSFRVCAALTYPSHASVINHFVFLARDSIIARYMLWPVRLSVRVSVWMSVTWHTGGSVRQSKTVEVRIMQLLLQSSSMTLVSSRLTSPRNSKENIGSEGAEWERGRKSTQFSSNRPNSPYNQKRCKIGPKLLLMTNRKSHMRFRLAPRSMTLDDIELL